MRSIDGFVPFQVVIKQAAGRRNTWRPALLGSLSAIGLVGIVTLCSKHAPTRSELLFKSSAAPWSDVPEVIRPDNAAQSAQEMAQAYDQMNKHTLLTNNPNNFFPLEAGAGKTWSGLASPSMQYSTQRMQSAQQKLPVAMVWPQSAPAPAVSEEQKDIAGHLQHSEDKFLRMPFDGHFPTDPVLPRPAVGNGLALGYYSLSNLPAPTAVQFANRETNFAGGVLRSQPAAQTSVDEAAAAAYRSGTQVVVDRRERDGILPRPLPASKAVEPQVVQWNQMSVSKSGDVRGTEKKLAAAQRQVHDLEKRILKLEAAKQLPSP